MEGFVWLLLKMAGLLATAGILFFVLGWWVRSRDAAGTTALQNEMQFEIERLKTAARSAEADRDEARREAQAVHEHLRVSAQEIDRLLAEQSRLQNAAAPPPEPAIPAKPKAKPRARRKKQEI